MHLCPLATKCVLFMPLCSDLYLATILVAVQFATGTVAQAVASPEQINHDIQTTLCTESMSIVY